MADEIMDVPATGADAPGSVQATPLPKLKCFGIAVVAINEAISISLLFPFIGYMVDDLHMTESKDSVGYYAGLVVSMFQFAQFLSGWFWGRMSDTHGRRPVILWGMCTSALFMPFFGFSTAFWHMIAARFLTGLCNGNFGAAKAYLGEITDDSNQAHGFSLLSFTWGLGTMIGPAIGGHLYDPATRFPNTFSRDSLFGKHRALLPCLAATSFTISAILIAYFVLPETNPHAKPLCGGWWIRQRRQLNVADEDHHDEDDNDVYDDDEEMDVVASSTNKVKKTKKSIGTMKTSVWHAIRTNKKMQVSLGLYVCISFIDIIFYEDFPLWALGTKKNGGLDMGSDEIGTLMIVNGLCCIFQPMLFPVLKRRVGALRLYRIGAVMWALLFFVLPFSRFAPSNSIDIILAVWMLVRSTFVGCVFSLTFLFITNTTAHEHLAVAHGIGQSLGCLARTVSPSLAGVMLAWSMTNGLPFPLNSHFVFTVSALIALGITMLSYLLKDEDVVKSW